MPLDAISTRAKFLWIFVQTGLILGLALGMYLWHPVDEPQPEKKSIYAFFTNEIVNLDGSLDEACWKDAPSARDFIVVIPYLQTPSPESTEVAIVSRQDGLYFGFNCHESGKISTDPGTRDRVAVFLKLPDREDLATLTAFAPSTNILVESANSPGYQHAVRLTTTGWSAEIYLPRTECPKLFRSNEGLPINFSRIHFAKEYCSSWYNSQKLRHPGHLLYLQIPASLP